MADPTLKKIKNVRFYTDTVTSGENEYEVVMVEGQLEPDFAITDPDDGSVIDILTYGDLLIIDFEDSGIYKYGGSATVDISYQAGEPLATVPLVKLGVGYLTLNQVVTLCLFGEDADENQYYYDGSTWTVVTNETVPTLATGRTTATVPIETEKPYWDRSLK